MKDTSKWAFETKQVHIGQESADSATGARAVPIYQTTSYVFPSSEVAADRFDLSDPGFIYTRLGNPTNDIFERRIAALESGVAALALASGSAATAYAVQNITRAGDHIVSDTSIYGGSYNLFEHTLKESGIGCTFVDASQHDQVAAAIQPNTKLIFVESLGNPNSDIVDIEALAEIAHAQGIPLIVDNTFATPFLLRPLERGADIVIHSATKFIGGHGTSLGGVIVDGGHFDWAASGKFPGLSEPHPGYHGVVFTDLSGNQAYIQKARLTLLRDTGSVLSPFHAWLFIQGLETLSLRVERHVANAIAVVEWLSKQPQIRKVNHPSIASHRDHALYQRYFPNGAGSIFSIEINGSLDQAKRFTEALQLFSLLANVADVKSLVIHPASTTHSQMTEAELYAGGITPTTIRLSIGIENIVDIIADLQQALNSI
ncbi:MAG: O-acetylhomoserine aminocarboxypropyltransferase/cysteine synthase [Coriobacteriales bacterium]|jgi:O-acetylhomoserine (thiol)-lyase|nr:O-acetylhomoserine aminocarboxypropyltransferase/cysteine synthase [Coriobacteriales bacterium]